VAPATSDLAKEVQVEACDPEELDLENVDQAALFISLHWSESNRPKVLPAIRFWVEQKALAAKKNCFGTKPRRYYLIT